MTRNLIERLIPLYYYNCDWKRFVNDPQFKTFKINDFPFCVSKITHYCTSLLYFLNIYPNNNHIKSIKKHWKVLQGQWQNVNVIILKHFNSAFVKALLNIYRCTNMSSIDYTHEKLEIYLVWNKITILRQ